MSDVIDRLAGLDDQSSTELRGHRPDVIASAQAAYEALLPATIDSDPVPSAALEQRLLVAARVAALEGDAAVLEHYGDRIGDDAVRSLAVSGPDRGAGLKAERRVRALLRHIDRLVLRPASATTTDLENLAHNGYSPADIVVFSQVATFVTFQLRVVHGLRVLAATTGATR